MSKSEKIKAIRDALAPKKMGMIRQYINGKLNSEHPSHDNKDHTINITIIKDENDEENKKGAKAESPQVDQD
jgi:hypothetical protein